MLSNITLTIFTIFTIYRTIIYRKQITDHEKERGTAKKTYNDKLGSYGIDILYVLTYLSCLYSWYAHHLNLFWVIVGFAIVGWSWKIRLMCFEQLGKNYGHEVKIFEDHQLVTTGLYSKMRHPMYARLILDVIGTAIISQFLLAWIFAICLIIVVLRRIHIEDKILVKKFGHVAIDYQNKVSAINIFKLI